VDIKTASTDRALSKLSFIIGRGRGGGVDVGWIFPMQPIFMCKLFYQLRCRITKMCKQLVYCRCKLRSSWEMI